MEGKKYDEGKTRMDLLPVDALEEVGRVMTFGANKYGERNWEKGMRWGRLSGAALRHIFSAMKGEPHDPETGCLHLAHAACCLLFLVSYNLRDIGDKDGFTSINP